MGMYTQLSLNFEIKRDAPEMVRKILEWLCHRHKMGRDGAWLEERSAGLELPDHPLFACYRWQMIGRGGGCGFQTNSQYIFREYECSASINCCFKNYDSEIEKFLDWVAPYLDTNGFLGYSLYEENSIPTLYFKCGDTVREVRPEIHNDDRHRHCCFD